MSYRNLNVGDHVTRMLDVVIHVTWVREKEMSRDIDVRMSRGGGCKPKCLV